MCRKPRSTSSAATVDLPLPMPPVSPMTRARGASRPPASPGSAILALLGPFAEARLQVFDLAALFLFGLLVHREAHVQHAALGDLFRQMVALDEELVAVAQDHHHHVALD